MAKAIRILIVEDDGEQLGRYLEMSKQLGFDVAGLQNLQDAKNYIAKKAVDVLLTDIHLTHTLNQNTFEGLKLIEHVNENYPEIDLLAMSSDPKLDTYQKVLRLGALYFIKKPIVGADEIAIAVEAARNQRLMKKASAIMSTGVSSEFAERCPDGLVLDQKQRDYAKKLATNTKVSIVLQGETGTGKEEYAKLIHRQRSLHEGAVPFIPINCANLTSDMAASLLFGHAKGAFTGADKTTNGYIGDANCGILFLDEIHSLTVDMQRRLLRVLNDGTYNRLGETRVLRSEFQLICASTKNLEDEVEKGNFLLDLLMRVTGFVVEMPPLRKRLHDLPLLVSLFLTKENVHADQQEFERIVSKCSKYYWQGNIRQLAKSIGAMVVNASMDDSPIKAEFLPVMATMLPPKSSENLSRQRFLGPFGLPADVLNALTQPLIQDCDLAAAVAEYERLVVQGAINRHERRQDAAASMKISMTILDELLNKYSR